MRNILLSESEKLLDRHGRPLQYGFGKSPIIKTNNKAINLFRLNEWDFYQITNEEFTVKIAYGHISIGGIMSFEIFDYKGNSYSLDSPIILPLRRLGMAPLANRR